jgi:hypothetical protein
MNAFKLEILTVAGREYRVLMSYYDDGRPMTAYTFFFDIPGWFVIQLRPEPRLAPMIEDAKVAAHLDDVARQLGYFND